MDNQIAAALIQAVATIIGATIAAIFVVIQIGKQARLSIAQSRDSEALRLKLDIYKQIVNVCAKYTEASSSLDSKLAMHTVIIPIWIEAIKASQPTRPVCYWEDINKLYGDVTDLAIEVVFLTERWQIIDPRLEVFRHAFVSGMHDIREAWHNMPPVGALTMPLNSSSDIQKWAPPRPDLLPSCIEVFHTLQNRISDISGYVADFQTAAQNLLLSELFQDRKVAPRVPLDPKIKAITLENSEALTRYFTTETAWGKHAAEVNAAVRASFANEAGAPPNTGTETQ